MNLQRSTREAGTRQPREGPLRCVGTIQACGWPHIGQRLAACGISDAHSAQVFIAVGAAGGLIRFIGTTRKTYTAAAMRMNAISALRKRPHSMTAPDAS